MITFKLSFKDQSIGVVPEALVTGFSYRVRMRSLYSVSRVTFKDVTKEIFNQLKVGQAVDIVFYDTENSRVQYVNPMKIRAFNKVPSANTELIDSITLELISSWYYVSTVQTGYYFGSSGSIIGEVMTKNFKSLGYDLEYLASSDKPKSRYQIQERPQAFMERLLKYSSLNGYPLCLYTDHKGAIRLKSIAEWLQNQQFYLATVLGTEDLLNSNTLDYALGKISLQNYNVQVSPTFSMCKAIHTVEHYHSAESYPKETSVMSFEGTGTSATDKKNIQIDEFSPVKVVITPWYVDPDDARSEFLYDTWPEISQTFRVLASCSQFQIDTVEIGHLIRLELPFHPVQNPTTGEEVNFAEGGYIVDEVTYVYENGFKSTQFGMFQVRF